MRIKLDDFLTAEELGEASQNAPAFAVIKEVNLIEARDLPFESSKGRYELTLEVNDEELKWLANKTSLRALRGAFGNDTDGWVEKSIKLWVVEQLVQGKMKRVIYAEAE